MTDVQVTVGISTRDRPDSLARCVASLEAGSVRPSQVVIVDQGNDTRAEGAVSAAQTQLAIDFIRQQGSGLARSQNEVFRHARCDIVAIIDDDCVADAAWLETIVDAFKGGGIDALTGRVIPQESDGDRVHPVSSRTSPDVRDFAGYAPPWLVGSGNNFAVTREWFTRAGGADEHLGPGSPAQGGVDMDLFYRLLRAGARIRYESAAIVRHERQTRAERQARRPMYGRGMGACVGRWLRRRDPGAARMLGQWVLLRSRLGFAALRRGDAPGMREELVMLASTVGGVLHGLSLNDEKSSRRS